MGKLKSSLLLATVVMFPLAAVAQISGTPKTSATVPGVATLGAASGAAGYNDTRLVNTSYYSKVACGASDVAAVLQADVSAFSAAGGGTYFLGKKSCKVLSADLTVPSNVAFRGSDNYVSGSVTNSDYSTALPAIILNPAHTIRVSSLSSVAGLTIISSAYTAPTSYRSAIDNLATWTGTAITLSSINNATVRDNFIIGFNTAISTEISANIIISNNRGDDLNGILDDNTHDVSTTEGNEFFPYMTAGTSWSVQGVNIAALANNGSGLWRVTLSTALPTGVQTGDRIWLANPSLPALSGSWIATVVDTTHVDLQGSAVAPSYTGATIAGSTVVTGLSSILSLGIGQTATGSGVSTTIASINPVANSITLSSAATASGTVALTFANPAASAGGQVVIDAGWRPGTAYSVTNSEGLTLLNNYEYNWNIGYHLGTGAAYNHLVSNSADGTYARFDPASTAFLIDGNAYGNDFVGGYNIDYGIPLLVNTSDTTPQAVTAMRIGATARYSVFLNSGAIALTSVAITGGNQIYIGDAATELIMNGMDIGGTPVTYQSPNDATKVSGASGAWTSVSSPVTTQGGALGSASATIRFQKVGRIVTFAATVAVTNVGTAAGYIGITMPFAAATSTAFGGRDFGSSRGYALTGTMPAGQTLLAIVNYDNSAPGINGGLLGISGSYEALF